jgi:hypothetical protein
MLILLIALLSPLWGFTKNGTTGTLEPFGEFASNKFTYVHAVPSEFVEVWKNVYLPEMEQTKILSRKWLEDSYIYFAGLWVTTMNNISIDKQIDYDGKMGVVGRSFYKDRNSVILIGNLKANVGWWHYTKQNFEIWQEWIKTNHGRPNQFPDSMISSLKADFHITIPWHSEFYNDFNLAGYNANYYRVIVNFDQLDVSTTSSAVAANSFPC